MVMGSMEEDYPTEWLAMRLYRRERLRALQLAQLPVQRPPHHDPTPEASIELAVAAEWNTKAVALALPSSVDHGVRSTATAAQTPEGHGVLLQLREQLESEVRRTVMTEEDRARRVLLRKEQGERGVAIATGKRVHSGRIAARMYQCERLRSLGVQPQLRRGATATPVVEVPRGDEPGQASAALDQFDVDADPQLATNGATSPSSPLGPFPEEQPHGTDSAPTSTKESSSCAQTQEEDLHAHSSTTATSDASRTTDGRADHHSHAASTPAIVNPQLADFADVALDHPWRTRQLYRAERYRSLGLEGVCAYRGTCLPKDLRTVVGFERETVPSEAISSSSVRRDDEDPHPSHHQGEEEPAAQPEDDIDEPSAPIEVQYTQERTVEAAECPNDTLAPDAASAASATLSLASYGSAIPEPSHVLANMALLLVLREELETRVRGVLEEDEEGHRQGIAVRHATELDDLIVHLHRKAEQQRKDAVNARFRLGARMYQSERLVSLGVRPQWANPLPLVPPEECDASSTPSSPRASSNCEPAEWSVKEHTPVSTKTPPTSVPFDAAAADTEEESAINLVDEVSVSVDGVPPRPLTPLVAVATVLDGPVEPKAEVQAASATVTRFASVRVSLGRRCAAQYQAERLLSLGIRPLTRLPEPSEAELEEAKAVLEWHKQMAERAELRAKAQRFVRMYRRERLFSLEAISARAVDLPASPSAATPSLDVLDRAPSHQSQTPDESARSQHVKYEGASELLSVVSPPRVSSPQAGPSEPDEEEQEEEEEEEVNIVAEDRTRNTDLEPNASVKITEEQGNGDPAPSADEDAPTSSSATLVPDHVPETSIVTTIVTTTTAEPVQLCATEPPAPSEEEEPIAEPTTMGVVGHREEDSLASSPSGKGGLAPSQVADAWIMGYVALQETLLDSRLIALQQFMEASPQGRSGFARGSEAIGSVRTELPPPGRSGSPLASPDTSSSEATAGTTATRAQVIAMVEREEAERIDLDRIATDWIARLLDLHEYTSQIINRGENAAAQVATLSAKQKTAMEELARLHVKLAKEDPKDRTALERRSAARIDYLERTMGELLFQLDAAKAQLLAHNDTPETTKTSLADGGDSAATIDESPRSRGGDGVTPHTDVTKASIDEPATPLDSDTMTTGLKCDDSQAVRSSLEDRVFSDQRLEEEHDRPTVEEETDSTNADHAPTPTEVVDRETDTDDGQTRQDSTPTGAPRSDDPLDLSETPKVDESIAAMTPKDDGRFIEWC